MHICISYSAFFEGDCIQRENQNKSFGGSFDRMKFSTFLLSFHTEAPKFSSYMANIKTRCLPTFVIVPSAPVVVSLFLCPTSHSPREWLHFLFEQLIREETHPFWAEQVGRASLSSGLGCGLWKFNGLMPSPQSVLILQSLWTRLGQISQLAEHFS